MRVLELWNAERFEDVMQGGRTRPLIIECFRADTTGRTEQKMLVVKAMGLPEITERGLFCEAVGNLLARELQIETPRPALVAVDELFVQAVTPALARRGLQLQPGIGVGAEYIKSGLANVVSNVFRTADERVQASRIYGFDLLTQNPDRRLDKPNCASFKGNFLAYDFELAFSFLLPLFGEQPKVWEVSKQGLGPKHLFYRDLRGHEISWKSFLADVHRLSDDKYLAQLMQGLPGEWQAWASKVRLHLIEAAAHLHELELELVRSLA